MYGLYKFPFIDGRVMLTLKPSTFFFYDCLLIIVSALIFRTNWRWSEEPREEVDQEIGGGIGVEIG